MPGWFIQTELRFGPEKVNSGAHSDPCKPNTIVSTYGVAMCLEVSPQGEDALASRAFCSYS